MIISKVISSNHIGFNAICKCDNCGKTTIKKYSVAIKFKTHFCNMDCKKTYCRGENHPSYGKVMSEAQKIKIGKANTGRIFSKEHREKLKNNFLGRKHTKETKRKMRLAQLGEKNHNWKNGRRKCKRGYIMLLKTEHPFAILKGYVMEHRLVMEKSIGRYLYPYEVVHHINGITDDNRIENLILFKNQKEHIEHHHQLLKKVS